MIYLSIHIYVIIIIEFGWSLPQLFAGENPACNAKIHYKQVEPPLYYNGHLVFIFIVHYLYYHLIHFTVEVHNKPIMCRMLYSC